MYTGLLHLHNILRWIILILLIVSIIQTYGVKNSGNSAKGIMKSSLFLLISAHITFLIGLYQWFAGPWGFQLIKNTGMGEVMKNSVYRFWAVEHLTGMLVAIILITIARGKVKKAGYKAAFALYIVALILILACIPWPFREGLARPLFPGVQ